MFSFGYKHESVNDVAKYFVFVLRSILIIEILCAGRMQNFKIQITGASSNHRLYVVNLTSRTQSWACHVARTA